MQAHPFMLSLLLLVTASSAGGAPDISPLSDPTVFRTILCRQGDEKVHTYRIPGLATSAKGTLLAVFDMRHTSSADLPGDVDVGLMRSTDDGRTWSKTQVILDFDKNEKDSRGNGVGDPTILIDHKTGHILVAALWSKGNRAWHGSGPGLEPEETGQFVLTRSTDDGVTWSKPVNITKNIAGRDPTWRLLFNGPGSGIQLRDGTLVIPAQFRDAKGAPHSCFIFSGDGGESWTISQPAIASTPHTSEAQIAELADDSLLLSMRNESQTGRRVWAKYTWKEELSKGTWSEPWLTVPDPTCMASLIRHPSGTLLFSNPNSASKRIALTIRASSDDGATWSVGRLIDPRGSMYSSMTVLKDGSIGVLYEGVDEKNRLTLHFAKFLPQWVGIGK